MTNPLRARRAMLAALANAPALLAIPTIGRAQPGSQGPIRLVHGYGSGSGPDILARLLAPPIGERLGATLIVDAKPGAGERNAAAFVARQPADGQTLYVMTGGQTVVAATDGSLQYDVQKSFSPITMLTQYPFALFVDARSPYRSLSDLLDDARRRPGTLTYSSSGVGTTLHLAIELIGSMTGVSLIHAPYKGIDAYNDLLGGVIQMSVGTLAGAQGLLKEGRLRALAVTSPQRWPGWADVPSVSETLPGYDVVTWTALCAPAGLSPALVARIGAACRDALQLPAVVERIHATGSLPFPTSPEAASVRVRDDVAKWRRVAEFARLDLK